MCRIALAPHEAPTDWCLGAVDFEKFLAKTREILELGLKAIDRDGRLVAPRRDPDPDAKEEDLGGDVGDAVLVGARA